MTAHTSRPKRILVVDDEPDLLDLYELTLLREGYLVHTAANLLQAREQLGQHTFEVMITDMRLPDGIGMELIHEIKSAQRGERCVVITAYGSADNAVDALKAGAFDYLTKPVDLKQFRSVIASAVTSARGSSVLSPAPSGKPAPGQPAQQALDRLVGQSACMRAIKERILIVASSMAPVMVTGESGTVKELVAHAIHCNSHRAHGPWVAVNCSAIPETLLEAEFFGSKKGAYTGAQQDRDGFFQTAHGGTLFLDEIGDLPLAMQSKLLRAIQERRIRSLGSTQEEAVDVRIISATNRNLAQDVEQGRFRQDLYYRLNGLVVRLPALRERQDLEVVTRKILASVCHSATPMGISPEVMSLFHQFPWPGNFRQLFNLLRTAVVMAGCTEEIQLQHLPDDFLDEVQMADLVLPRTSLAQVDMAQTAPEPVKEALRAGTPLRFESTKLENVALEAMAQALRSTGGNVSVAAKMLGVSRNTIYRKKASLPADVWG